MNLPELGGMLPALIEALSSVGIGVTVIVDRGAGFERWYSNAPAAALLGYTVEEFQAMRAIDSIAPEQHALIAQLSASYRSGAPVPPALELMAVRKDGSYMPLELALGSVRMSDGVAYVMVVRDATSLQRSYLSLLEADRIALLGALAAGFAHEINNPLTTIGLKLRTLRKHLAAAPQGLTDLEDIHTSADRIAGIVRAIETLATRGATTTVDLTASVSACLSLATPTLEHRAHVIRYLSPVPRVAGEESRIGQAVLAMLLFSGSGFDDEQVKTNRITVRVEARGRDVILEVSDNGRDLPPEDAQRAFDPFYQSSLRGAGVGAGLGVARSVAATLGGEVSLASRPGGGAVITMRLPVAAT